MAGLAKFFSDYPDLIPPNVRLHLNQYKGNQDEIKNVAMIQGAGQTDHFYEKRVEFLAKSVQLRQGKIFPIEENICRFDVKSWKETQFQNDEIEYKNEHENENEEEVSVGHCCSCFFSKKSKKVEIGKRSEQEPLALSALPTV